MVDQLVRRTRSGKRKASCNYLQTLTVRQLYRVRGPPIWPSSSLIGLVNGVAQAHVLHITGGELVAFQVLESSVCPPAPAPTQEFFVTAAFVGFKTQSPCRVPVYSRQFSKRTASGS
jgi:hypothetical protein